MWLQYYRWETWVWHIVWYLSTVCIYKLTPRPSEGGFRNTPILYLNHNIYNKVGLFQPPSGVWGGAWIILSLEFLYVVKTRLHVKNYVNISNCVAKDPSPYMKDRFISSDTLLHLGALCNKKCFLFHLTKIALIWAKPALCDCDWLEIMSKISKKKLRSPWLIFFS